MGADFCNFPIAIAFTDADAATKGFPHSGLL